MRGSVNEAQAPLRVKYKDSPDSSMVLDHAIASSGDHSDPFHSRVEPMDGCGVVIPVGVHQAVGGPHDAPTPGDILCAALAACQDSSVRMVANLLGIELSFLEVRVTAEVDVRGTLGLSKDVPVGFQSIRCEVNLKAKEGTNPELLKKLSAASEYCCVVQQTLKNPPRVQTQFNF
ncbi:OsmC family protein [Geothrix sp. SG200]|uniref:OsmC family protein n=1 Tax=Geothrix sp. SG200 TaxID=2922865 RepID=UPI001FABC8B1|nr:OsmC family protein [Geothrix sp. SG200]